MMGRQQRWGVRRRAFGVLAIIALSVKLLVPAGFMPGTSWARPIMLCSGQGPMPMAMAMDQTDHRSPSKAPHDKADHDCAFAGIGAAALAPALDGPMLAAVIADRAPAADARRGIAPGRGMAAPPPPSHAPPLLRA